MENRFEGRWISGTKGSARLTELAVRLQDQTTLRYFPEMRGYQPWMSCLERLGYFRNEVDGISSGLDKKTDIVTDPRMLEILHRAFFLSPDEPFGLVDPSLKGMKVALDGEISLAEFETELSMALDLVRRSSDTFELRMTKLATQFIPLAPAHPNCRLREMGSGLSTHFYKGGVFLSLPQTFPQRTTELAINIVHEIAHQALMVYQNADEIMVTSYDEQIYSPVRKTNRPAILSFHAVVALAYMAEFLCYALRIDLPEADAKYARARLREISSDLEIGLSSMRQIEFTEFGVSLLNEITELSEWTKVHL